MTDHIFQDYFKHEFQIDAISSLGEHIVFTSKNELFFVKQKVLRKLATLESKITKIHVEDRLIYVGTNTGDVNAYTTSKTCVCKFANHSGAITAIKFWNGSLITAGLDGMLYFYDIAEASPFKQIDVKSSIVAIDVIGNVLYVASDTIVGICLETYEVIYRSPFSEDGIEDMVCEGTSIVYVVKNVVNILDLSTWNLTTKICHTKTITKVCIFKNLLYTSSSDGHFKSWTLKLKNINSFKFNDPLSGFMLLNERPFVASKSGRIFSTPRKSAPKLENGSKYIKLNSYEEEVEYKLIKTKSNIRTKLEGMIGRYEYKKAFKCALACDDLEHAYSVLKHIHEKRSLKRLLSDQSEGEVAKFMEFIADNYRISEFTAILNECMIIITAVYDSMIRNSEELGDLLEMISQIVNEDTAFYEKLIQSIGFLS